MIDCTGSTKSAGGLADVFAGETSISTVGKQGRGLSYRGYAIEDLAAHAGFEEVAFLLLYGELPDRHALTEFRRRAARLRELPEGVKALLERLPETSHPMDVLRSGVSVLGCLEPEHGFERQETVAERLLAALPAMLLYWYARHRRGVRIDTDDDPDGYGPLVGFLRMLHGESPPELQRHALEVSLILYAEHEFNASTFAARVTASTRADFHSCITTAIGTLRGPLHGGANEAAMAFLETLPDPDAAEAAVLAELRAHRRVMGFGHRVYRESDPRSVLIKPWSRRLAADAGADTLFAVSERIEQVMWREKRLFPNLDFYSASLYHFLGIPTALYTSVFVCARMAGWAAHVIEQRRADRLIRPLAHYIGPLERAFVPLGERG